MKELAIGCMDSGMGGLSFLRKAMRALPHENFIYYGDNGNAPYGTRPREEIEALSLAAAEQLTNRGIKALVVACNTATSAAGDALRKKLSVPVIGMEPALRDAQEEHKAGRILVLATSATLSLPRFQEQLALYGRDAYPQPCPGLMEFVERGETEGPALEAFLRGLLAEHLDKSVESVILGCTHYPFVQDTLAKLFPGARFYDGVARPLQALQGALEARNALRTEGEGGATLCTSGNAEEFLPRMRGLLYGTE